MKEPIWVLREVVVAVHQMLLAEHGGLPGVRDGVLLDSALARPRQRLVYEADLSVFDLAASYGYGLIKNRPFVDGNKRIALATAAVFLELNGRSLEAPEAETVIVIEQLAAGELSEQEFAVWLEARSMVHS